MENLKIKLNGKKEGDLAQKLFFDLGYGFEGCKNKTIQEFEYRGEFYLFAYSDKDLTVSNDYKLFSQKKMHKEITIDQIRDMVVLKRNDLKDATHYDSFVASEVLKCILIGDWWYLFTGGKWQQFCHIDSGRALYIKPIPKEEAMKEWIYKDGSGKYVLTIDPEVANLASDAIEVPNGGNYRTPFYFWEDMDSSNHFINGWCDAGETLSDYLKRTGVDILWQREKPQEKCADVCVEAGGNNVQSTLEERESQYGSFSDVAKLTCGLMGGLVRPDMSFVQREALHMICSKLARISCGDVNKIDSWHDIAGYATLVVQDLEKKAIDADKINQSDNRDWVEEIESSKD